VALPKNPARVPDFSQTHDPVGRDPEGCGPVRDIRPVGVERIPTMPKVEKTGVYRRKDGGPSVFLREGHELLPEEMDAIELVEAADKREGAPEKRVEKPAKAERKKAD